MQARTRSSGGRVRCARAVVAGAVILGLAATGHAADAPKIDSGDTAWMLTSAALVLMMTAPGLALFYGGLVRSKNVLSVVMQSFILMALISVQWSSGATAWPLAPTTDTSLVVSSGWVSATSGSTRTPTTVRPSRTRPT